MSPISSSQPARSSQRSNQPRQAQTIAVVSAGLSEPSSTRLLADQLASSTQAELARNGTDSRVRVIELRGLAHDIVNNLLTGFPATPLRAAIETVSGADGLIAVTPTFSASYSGLFKSFFDVIGAEALVDKPVLIAATGGTARHSLALEHAMRPMFAYLRAIVVPTAVYAAMEDWAGGTADAALRTRIQRAAAQLADLVERHEPAATGDPFALTTTFEQLLADNNPS
jgi:FMN reductase